MRAPYFALLAACSTSDVTPNATLAELPDLALRVIARPEVTTIDADTRPTELAVFLEYDDELFGPDPCATLAGITARFDGIPLSLQTNGRQDDAFGYCVLPMLGGTVELGLAGEHEVVVEDGTHTITARFDNTFAARTATLVSHPQWSFAAGDEVVVVWSHPAEVPDIRFEQDFDDFFDMRAERVDDELHFRIAEQPPLRGDGRVSFIGTPEADRAIECTGADACILENHRSFVHTATIR